MTASMKTVFIIAVSHDQYVHMCGLMQLSPMSNRISACPVSGVRRRAVYLTNANQLRGMRKENIEVHVATWPEKSMQDIIDQLIFMGIAI